MGAAFARTPRERAWDAVFSFVGGVAVCVPLLGVAWLLFVILAFGVLSDASPGTWVKVVVWALTVLPLAGWAWSRRYRWFALGMVAGLGVPWALAEMTSDPDPGPVAVEAKLAAYAADSDYTVYYLGRSFAGMDLAFADKEPGGRIDAEYGEVCDLEGCSWLAEVSNEPYTPLPGPTRGCRRLPPMRGVPAISLSGIILFTGGSTIHISAETRESALAMVNALREVRGGPSTAELPPPDANVLPNLRQACPKAAS